MCKHSTHTLPVLPLLFDGVRCLPVYLTKSSPQSTMCVFMSSWLSQKIRRRLTISLFPRENRNRENALICKLLCTSYVSYCVPTCFFVDICTLFSGARGPFIALSAPGQASGPPVHHGASLGPGRAPWGVIWACKVAKSIK